MKELDKLEAIVIEKPRKINYVEIGFNRFLKDILNNSNTNFLDYNQHSLYILKNGNHKDIKRLLVEIEGHCVNVVRGSSQKSHFLSPLDLRLSSYMMALSNFDYQYLSKLNMFHDITKDRYLPSQVSENKKE